MRQISISDEIRSTHTGVRVAYSLVFYVVSCVLLFVCLFFFLIFSHGVVSLFSNYEFGCPSGIFRPSF